MSTARLRRTSAAAVLFALGSLLGQAQEPREARDERLRWWRDARFGMFIHWGLYAVPAGEWKGQRSKEIGQWIPATGLPGVDWESCMTMNTTWGYKSYDDQWKSPETLIRNVIDTASKGGNYLLNVGPTAEGEIPPPSVERLAAIGRWMKVNGESIYGTTASPFAGGLPWGRATVKANRVYLHVFDWPADGKLQVPGFTGTASRAYLLADRSRKVTVSQAGDALTIQVPGAAPDPVANVIVIER